MWEREVTGLRTSYAPGTSFRFVASFSCRKTLPCYKLGLHMLRLYMILWQVERERERVVTEGKIIRLDVSMPINHHLSNIMVMGYAIKHVEGVFLIRLGDFRFSALKAFRQWRRKANQLIKARGMQGMDWQIHGAIPKETAEGNDHVNFPSTFMIHGFKLTSFSCELMALNILLMFVWSIAVHSLHPQAQWESCSKSHAYLSNLSRFV